MTNDSKNDPTGNYDLYRVTIDIFIPEGAGSLSDEASPPINYVSVEDEATMLGYTSEKLVVTPANGGN